MKMSHLSPIDLAANALLEADEQRKNLERALSFYSTPCVLTYNALRDRYQDIFNVSLPYDKSPKPTDWAVIEKLIQKNCRRNDNDKELDANLRRAKALHDFAMENGITGYDAQFPSLTLSDRISVTFWLPMVLVMDDEPTIVYIDPRRSGGLNSDESLKFVFSIMDVGVRERRDDYANAQLAIIRFRCPSGGIFVKLHKADNVELLTYETLQAKIRHTYAIWRAIHEESQSAHKRASTK